MIPHDDSHIPGASSESQDRPPSDPFDSAYAAEPILARPAFRAERNEAPPEIARQEQESGPSPILWTRLISALLFLGMGILVLFIAPFIKAHWRSVDARSEAEAIFLARRAELRAEAEVHLEKRRAELKEEAAHAEKTLAALDNKVDLVSLGFRQVARKVAPLVVNVQNLRQPKPADLGPLAKRSLVYDPEMDQKFAQAGVGSGLIVKPGVIVTNHHVVKGGERLRITFASGHSIGIDMDAVAADAVTDLAVIRLPEELPDDIRADIEHTTPFANSDVEVHVGDWALAVGSPLGLRQTLTQGVVSAKGRLLALLDMVELLQTDAAIHPGNSGGPLFDQRGKLMGINVAIATDNGANQGIGFTIPSNTARKIVDQLLTLGEVPRGYLGIALDDLPGPRAKALFLEEGGVQILQVMPGQAAHKAGLLAGDVIVKYNEEHFFRGQPARHLRQLIVDTTPGSDATLEVIRSGETQTLRVTIGKRPADLR